MPQTTPFADVILPIPLAKLFTYRVPTYFCEFIALGSRVIVPFGKSKVLTGIVANIHTLPPTLYKAKAIFDVLDHTPSINPIQLKFFQWLAQYYVCTLGEVVNVALPTGLKVSSQSKLQLNPAYNPSSTVDYFSEKEKILLSALQVRKVLTYDEAAKIVVQKNIAALLKSLLQKHAVLLFEEIKEKYHPKKIKKLRLHATYIQNAKALATLFQQLEKKPKQLNVLLKYAEKIPIHQMPKQADGYLSKNELLQADISRASLDTLIKQRIFIEKECIVSRFAPGPTTPEPAMPLSPVQTKALQAIHAQWIEKDVVLLHGITGSGKTEIYVQLICEALASGTQVLYLLPEIALTTQIVSRLRKIFVDQLGVYHSKYADNERVEVWQGVLKGKFSLIVGVRSALFLPFGNLSLVIVDEEHETAYKQFDPAPRYHARDAALVLAKHHCAKVLLGSATPAVESYHNAQQGKYGLVKLEERFGQVALPAMLATNLSVEQQRKTLRNHFSAVLLEALQHTLDAQEQAIIFQNRRGYAPYITCEICAWVPTCAQCAVSLTYHQFKHALCCHYCGYRMPMPNTCHVCEAHQLKNIGFGTEKLEEDLQLIFPKARIQRMDLDTTRRKNSYETIIKDFEKGATDILVGTQMITKGLDFGKVALVGVVDADRMLHFPDFRANERYFQLITQVSGRAGRRDQQGQVVIQTAHTKHPIIDQVIRHDYMGMYEQELAERKRFLYPPYVRLIKLIVKHTEQAIVEQAAETLANSLKKHYGKWVLGPQAPVIPKLKNQYLSDIWLKIKKDAYTLSQAKAMILQEIGAVWVHKAFKKIKIVVDVDPM